MKNIKNILLGAIAVCCMASCSDNDYAEKYPNPSETTVASMDKLLTGAFYQGREYTYNSYWREYTWENGIIVRYTQNLLSHGYGDGTRYSAQDGYVCDRWNNFYGILAQYRVMQDLYESESEAKQKEDKIYLDLVEVYLYDQLSQMVDVFGDVPFTKAGYLGLTGDVVASYADYDDQKDLYKTMLTRLGELSKDIAAAQGNLAPAVAKGLPAHDFINGGDLSKWEKYCNALRLRLAVRCASQGDLAATAKDVIKEVAGKALPTEFNDNVYVVSDRDGFFYRENFRDGWKDDKVATTPMLKVLMTEASLGQNDYRLPVMFNQNAKDEYKGYDVADPLADYTKNRALPEEERVYSYMDSTLYWLNDNLLSPIVTTAEVDFLLAEAYQNGWAQGDAKAAFEKGIAHSTEWYYHLNMTSNSEGYQHKQAAAPAEADVRAYAAKVWDAASNKVDAIITQKWLHMGFFQPTQNWADIRRTGYPSFLNFPVDANAQLLKNVPNRIVYPSVERNSNKTKYEDQLKKMGGTDDPYKKIFWAK